MNYISIIIINIKKNCCTLISTKTKKKCAVLDIRILISLNIILCEHGKKNKNKLYSLLKCDYVCVVYENI